MSIRTRLRRSALTAVLVLPLGGALPAAATPAVPDGACVGSSGVTVVVDSTDLGGDVEVGCAEGDPATGRQALEAAGFEPTDSIPGMICAIDALPDPCPEEFQGSYWAYFGAEPGEEWAAQTAGADAVDPDPGSFEGWRYNDGTAGPGITTAQLAGAATATAAPEQPADDEVASDSPAPGDQTGGAPPAAESTDTTDTADTDDADGADDAADSDGAATEGDGQSVDAATIASIAVVVVVLGVIAAVTLRRRQG
ncbi:hypothetical protein [Georgenia subflava]|uniref:Uncharacterized protein n=1 Tax=Georgenia subflava TaxID=1622177 RepID=A0A6N7EBU8_9MICO|nr:hypothetical protein [Georgenia subflava]MPV35892.1 hypothetical protein [Georgenia subflava]